jgi:hypothetical protein
MPIRYFIKQKLSIDSTLASHLQEKPICNSAATAEFDEEEKLVSLTKNLNHSQRLDE